MIFQYYQTIKNPSLDLPKGYQPTSKRMGIVIGIMIGTVIAIIFIFIIIMIISSNNYNIAKKEQQHQKKYSQ